jgi:hypothetical protein
VPWLQRPVWMAGSGRWLSPVQSGGLVIRAGLDVPCLAAPGLHDSQPRAEIAARRAATFRWNPHRPEVGWSGTANRGKVTSECAKPSAPCEARVVMTACPAIAKPRLSTTRFTHYCQLHAMMRVTAVVEA